MFKEKLEKILDDSFGMFLQDKDNPIYKNLRDEVVNNTASLIADELPKEKKRGDFLEGITHADKELAEIQAVAMRMGFNQCLKELKTKLGIRKGCE